jgi:hypothetical protein
MMGALTDLSAYKAVTGISDPTWLALIDDVNGDGTFTYTDLQALLNLLKSGGGSANSIPEPSAFFLAALGLTTITHIARPFSGNDHSTIPGALRRACHHA